MNNEELVKAYQNMVVNHFVRYDYEVTAKSVKKAIHNLVMNRVQFETAEDCLRNMYPQKEAQWEIVDRQNGTNSPKTKLESTVRLKQNRKRIV